MKRLSVIVSRVRRDCYCRLSVPYSSSCTSSGDLLGGVEHLEGVSKSNMYSQRLGSEALVILCSNPQWNTTWKTQQHTG